MKIGLTADWHFRGKDLRAATAQLRALIYDCFERNVGLVCVAGDIFDAPNIHDAHATTGAIAGQILRCLNSGDLRFLMIPGNHDYRGVGQTDALAVLESLPNVTVARRAGWVAPPFDYRDCPIEVFCLPWNWNGEDAGVALTAAAYGAEHAKARLLLAHVQVVGARMAGLKTCEAGTWCVTRERLQALVDAELFHRVCLGDFHARQDLTGGKGGFIGALRQLNHGEEGNPAGFEIWDTETNAVEWVELDEAPRYFTFTARSPEDLLALDWDDKDRAKIRCEGFTPDRATIEKCEADGAIVEQIVEAVERTARVESIPEGIIDRPHDILNLWASQQSPVIEGEALVALHAELDALLAPNESTTNGSGSHDLAREPLPWEADADFLEEAAQ